LSGTVFFNTAGNKRNLIYTYRKRSKQLHIKYQSQAHTSLKDTNCCTFWSLWSQHRFSL